MNFKRLWRAEITDPKSNYIIGFGLGTEGGALLAGSKTYLPYIAGGIVVLIGLYLGTKDKK